MLLDIPNQLSYGFFRLVVWNFHPELFFVGPPKRFPIGIRPAEVPDPRIRGSFRRVNA
jgi:hypothetical protein